MSNQVIAKELLRLAKELTGGVRLGHEKKYGEFDRDKEWIILQGGVEDRQEILAEY